MDITKIAAGIGMLQKFVGKAALNPRVTGAAVGGIAGAAAGGAMGNENTAMMGGAAGALAGAVGGKALMATGIKSLSAKGQQYVAEGIKANVVARPAEAAAAAASTAANKTKAAPIVTAAPEATVETIAQKRKAANKTKAAPIVTAAPEATVETIAQKRKDAQNVVFTKLREKGAPMGDMVTAADRLAPDKRNWLQRIFAKHGAVKPGTLTSYIKKNPDKALGMATAATGATAGAVLDEDNRIGGALAGGIIGGAAGVAAGQNKNVQKTVKELFSKAPIAKTKKTKAGKTGK